MINPHGIFCFPLFANQAVEIIKLFSCSTGLSMKCQLLIKTKMLKLMTFLAFNIPDVVFVMLINVKMPTNIYEHDKFHAVFS